MSKQAQKDILPLNAMDTPVCWVKMINNKMIIVLVLGIPAFSVVQLILQYNSMTDIISGFETVTLSNHSIRWNQQPARA